MLAQEVQYAKRAHSKSTIFPGGAMSAKRTTILLILCFAVLIGVYNGCRSKSITTSAGKAGELEQVALSRELSPQEASAALETFIAPGKFDEFVMFTSCGHSG